jgi:hypothetical protein
VIDDSGVCFGDGSTCITLPPVQPPTQPTTITGIFRAGDDLILTSQGSIIANGLDLVANAAAKTVQIGDLRREIGALRAEIQSCQCTTEVPTIMPTFMPTGTPTGTPAAMPTQGPCVPGMVRGNISNFGNGGRTSDFPATLGRPCAQCGGIWSVNDAMAVFTSRADRIVEYSPPLPSSSAADLFVGRDFESMCELEAHLHINSPSAITSTELETAFTQLEWTGGNIDVKNASGLTSFGTAFTQVQGVAGNLVIERNANLATLGAAFSQLEYVAYNFWIVNNPVLSSFGSAFSSLKRIKGQLHIYGNDLDEADFEVFRGLECHGENSYDLCPDCPAWLLNLPECA